MSKYLKWILAASFALNIFLAGGFVGHVVGKFGPEMMVERLHQDLLSRLPKEKADRFHSAMMALMEKHRADMQNEDPRKPLIAIMSAKEFDADAMRKTFRNMNVKREAFEYEMLETVIGFAQTLTQEERKSFAEHLSKAPPMPPMGGPPPGDIPH